MYLFAGMSDEALYTILKIPPEVLNMDHWLLYRKAEAELGVGKLDDGLKTAERALVLARDDKKGLERIASYHELLSKCHEALGATEAAIAQMETALEACQAGKYKNALAGRLEELKR